MKKLGYIVLIILGVIFPFHVQAIEKVPVYIFKSVTCPHCTAALSFFEQLEAEYGQYYELIPYETSDNQENRELLKTVATVLDKSSNSVPFIIIGKESFVGYSSAKDEAIKKAIIEEYHRSDRYDVMDHLNEIIEEPEDTKDDQIPVVPKDDLSSNENQKEKDTFSFENIIYIILGVLGILGVSVLLVIQKKGQLHE